MRRLLSLCCVLPLSAWSVDLIQFESGKAALARDVNENFHRLDTAIENRAVKSGVDAVESSLKATDAALKGMQATVGQLQTSKVDQSSLDKALPAKADTSSLGSLARQHKSDVDALNASLKSALTSGSLTGIRDSLRLKADSSAFNALKRQTESGLASKQASLGFTPLNAAGGTVSGDLTVSKSLTVGAGVSAGGFKTGGDVSAPRGRFDTLIVPGGLTTLYPDGDHGAIYGDKAGAPGSLNYSFAWKRDGSASYLRTSDQYVVLRQGSATPVFGDGKKEYDFWHSGNLDPNSFLRDAGVLGLGAFTNKNPPVGSWSFDCHCGVDPSGDAPIGSANIQVFSTGNSSRGLQLAGAYDSDNLFFRRGVDGWSQWVPLIHPGNIKQYAVTAMGGTITGDLKITGKLTTAPGETPADYVFEPDYKLAPLAEVEAFTKANKHLPEVPSASEMTENGVDLARMNMVLLKKVEELTLHAIEQQKILDAQRQELNAQKDRLERLEARR